MASLILVVLRGPTMRATVYSVRDGGLITLGSQLGSSVSRG